MLPTGTKALPRDGDAPLAFQVRVETILKHDDGRFLVPPTRGRHSGCRKGRKAGGRDDAPEAPAHLGSLLRPPRHANRRPGSSWTPCRRRAPSWTGRTGDRGFGGRLRRDARLAFPQPQSAGDWGAGPLQPAGRAARRSAAGEPDRVCRLRSDERALDPVAAAGAPPGPKFDYAHSGCAQWLAQADGTVLVPLTFGLNARQPFGVTVAQCAFDGSELKYLRHETSWRERGPGAGGAITDAVGRPLLPDDPERPQGLRQPE